MQIDDRDAIVDMNFKVTKEQRMIIKGVASMTGRTVKDYSLDSIFIQVEDDKRKDKAIKAFIDGIKKGKKL